MEKFHDKDEPINSSLAWRSQGAAGQLLESKCVLASNMFSAPDVATSLKVRSACSVSPQVRIAKCQSRAAVV